MPDEIKICSLGYCHWAEMPETGKFSCDYCPYWQPVDKDEFLRWCEKLNN